MAEAEKVMGVSADDIEKIMGVEAGDIEKFMGVEIPSGGFYGTRLISGGGLWFDLEGAAQIYGNIIQYKSSTSNGNASNFGDLTRGALSPSGAVSNIARAVFAGSRLSGSVYGTDTMDYITVGSTGNASDFGDNSEAQGNGGSAGNGILGFTFCGTGAGAEETLTDFMSYITIASTGNATDAGNMEASKYRIGGWSGTTRGGSWGGATGSGTTQTAQISYIEFHTSNNASDFGDLSQAAQEGNCCYSEVRVVGNHGKKYDDGNVELNNIDYITVSSTGNASDFGDLISTYRLASAAGDGTRGEWWAGESSDYRTDTIQSITIASTGNATDRGNCLDTAYIGNGGVSGT